MKDIEQWFSSNKDFKTGVTLYAHYSTNKAYDFLFSLGENSYSKEVLEEQLQELLLNNKIPEEKPTTKTKIDPLTLPHSLRKRYTSIQELYGSTKYLKSRLELFSEKQRSTMCGQIVSNTKTIYEHYRHINHYIETGVELDEKPASNQTDDIQALYIQMLKDIKRLPQYISKNKKNTAMAVEVQEAIERLEYINQVIANGRII